MPSSGNKSKTSGIRILWIPGGRKGHPKGRFDATNKRITHTGGQKKSEVWSLGGRKAQTDLLNAEPDTTLLDGPSVSRLAPITTYTLGAGTVAVAAGTAEPAVPTTTTVEAVTAADSSDNKLRTESPTNIPCTPNSTTSTAPLLSSSPHSPHPDSSVDSSDEMRTQSKEPVIITTTTTAEIIDENKFSILGKDLPDEENFYELPVVPKTLQAQPQTGDSLALNSSSGTSASTAETSPATSPKSDANGGYSSPIRKKNHHHRNHNNQEDVNSIESITENDAGNCVVKVPDDDLKWCDILSAQEKSGNPNASVIVNLNGNVVLNKSSEQNGKRKKKNKFGKTKELDQLDGVVMPKTATKTHNNNNINNTDKKKQQQQKGGGDEPDEDKDEKFVQCLYYGLMCCDCTIS